MLDFDVNKRFTLIISSYVTNSHRLAEQRQSISIYISLVWRKSLGEYSGGLCVCVCVSGGGWMIDNSIEMVQLAMKTKAKNNGTTCICTPARAPHYTHSTLLLIWIKCLADIWTELIADNIDDKTIRKTDVDKIDTL